MQADAAESFETLRRREADSKNLQVSVGTGSNVAWYMHRRDARILTHGSTTTWTGVRFTGVFEKREGTWKTVQPHVLLPELG